MENTESLFKNYPPFLDKNQQDFLVSELIDYAQIHGISMRQKPSKSKKTYFFENTHIPFTLYPSLFPSIVFKKAKAIQCDFNKLYAFIANDEDFMAQIIKDLSTDSFIKKLWDIHLEVRNKGIVQPISLGIFRSDYFVQITDNSLPQLKQIEFNTISASFAAFASKISKTHKHLYKIGAYESSPILKNSTFPENNPIESIIKGIATADKLYGGKETKVLLIIGLDEPFVFDQRLFEYKLFKIYGIQTYRLRQNDKALLFKSPNSKIEEISVVYFRTGYSPEHYTSSNEWSARLLIEESRAIKCPTIMTQLSGCKKVQQVLCEKNIIEKFLPENSSNALRETFAPIYALGTDLLNQKAYHLLINNPQNYILKPQREGGGNNIYGFKILDFLKTVPETSKQYILMERIHSPFHANIIIKDGEVYHIDGIDELGIYGIIVWDKDGTIYYNKESGYLLRTKDKSKDEGGVVAGYSSINSCALIP
ncbi:unnamed protein product [Pneumocystis jirovecii]|uniref:Glutathione synthetase n=1 Tax=Pneumocystis jirovecii TaxID=42068 RepID=L0P9T5_PNEJI|nr:unnamed protein product [Pneumocystis jirovecii]